MEKLLYYVWEHRLFDNRNLLTTKGEKIEIIDPNYYDYLYHRCLSLIILSIKYL